MTDDRPGDEDLSAQSFSSDEERGEHEWLIARETNPNAPPPSPETAQCYAHLEALLGNLTAGETDEHRQAQILESAIVAAAKAPPQTPTLVPWWRRPAIRWAMTGGGVLAAAAIFLVCLYPFNVPGPSSSLVALPFTIVHSGTSRADPKEAVHGDNLVAPLPRGAYDLRLYNPDGALVARCPNGPACAQTADGSQIDLELDAVGTYYLILAAGTTQLPLDSTMSDFITRAGSSAPLQRIKVH